MNSFDPPVTAGELRSIARVLSMVGDTPSDRASEVTAWACEQMAATLAAQLEAPAPAPARDAAVEKVSYRKSALYFERRTQAYRERFGFQEDIENPALDRNWPEVMQQPAATAGGRPGTGERE